MSLTLECVFYGGFRPIVGEKTFHHETEVTTVGEVLRELESRFPGLEGRLLASAGGGGPDDIEATVRLDGTDVGLLEGVATPLEDGCELGLVPYAYIGSP